MVIQYNNLCRSSSILDDGQNMSWIYGQIRTEWWAVIRSVILWSCIENWIVFVCVKWYNNIKPYNFICWIVWFWNLSFHLDRGIYSSSTRECWGERIVERWNCITNRYIIWTHQEILLHRRIKYVTGWA